ncbi:anti-sigma factor family protein [Brachyspira alvinipulli]|uniref:anti-sigma factor family protein n=1 Tax=Brachyspira alvinipulli TaxID=84379 RepID=UPI000489F1A7|nr:zf-HC2 domain-containing protein [Brachyspira alvinipulli]
MKNNHEYYEMLISRYMDNDLESDEIFEMEKHLSTCKSCQKFRDELNSMSSILSGKKPIVVHKKSIFNKSKLPAYIGSIAAALLLFVGISIVYNNPNSSINNDDTKLIVSDLNNSVINTSIDNTFTDDDYTPLSSYFSYSDQNDEGEEAATGEISIMSAYIYYMGK